MATTPGLLVLRASLVVVVGVWLFACSSSSSSGSGSSSSAATDRDGSAGEDGGTSTTDAAACYPDNDGINGGAYTFDLVVDDTGFYGSAPDAGMKEILATQNDAQVTLTLKNTGTTPHGFKVGCTNASASYPDLPAGCSPTACFPSNAAIPPLAPGASATITFDTPTPDGLIYPFTSSEAADKSVPGLNGGQWTLM